MNLRAVSGLWRVAFVAPALTAGSGTLVTLRVCDYRGRNSSRNTSRGSLKGFYAILKVFYAIIGRGFGLRCALISIKTVRKSFGNCLLFYGRASSTGSNVGSESKRSGARVFRDSSSVAWAQGICAARFRIDSCKDTF